MSWHGTVHCSYCGTRGHNRASCPERLKYISENPSGYEASVYRLENERRKERAKKRKCTYCSEGGHNRRGCTTRKNDIAKINERQTIYTNSFADHCNSLGFTPGALFTFSDSTRKTLLYLENFLWRSISFALKDHDHNYAGQVPWDLMDTKLLVGRVISDQIAQDDDWTDPHIPGEQSYVCFGSLQSLFPNHLVQPPEPVDTASNRYTGQQYGEIEIVSPIFEAEMKPDIHLVSHPDPQKQSRTLERYFQVSASNNRRDHNSQRLRRRDSYELWKNIYPESYAKAHAASG